ncbi:MAG: hypothetical protein JSS97_01560 [Actinobacteria bacterium]|nr:hypothetical protein [Actinomycetota bacterium]
MKFVCGQIAEREGVGVNKYVRPIVDHLKSTPLADVAASFCDLQEARHRADYDHTAIFSKAAVAAHINDARKAIGTIESSDEDDLRELAALLALSARANLG